ncbi:histone deacetylase 4-like isoform X3 [Physella acuta]|uniref:histone deacetylase 4-like isoform X3 n=1 Tax=Physella acuta TaxID=109671 RepID=UPI0027DBBCD3|nr:histone deacetylase 4-like isoform X3 [Physella acuta]
MTSNNYQQYYSSSGNKFYKGSTSVDSGFQEPIDPVAPHETAMEVNTYQQQLARKDRITDQQLQQQLNCLKQQQQIQQHMLLEQYEHQRQQLEQQHEKQLQEHTKYLRHKQLLQQQHEKQVQEHIQVFLEQQQLQQKQLEQQRLEKEMFEQERLQQIKNKTKDEESAIASSAVKLKLQEFVLTKKHREAVKDLNNSPPQFRHHWVSNQGSLDQGSPPLNLSPPYTHHLLAKYEDDFPLRKTASESNILKIRSALKQKKEVRRTMITHSPLAGRRDKGPLGIKRKTPLSIDTGVCSSNPDSGPNSPPGSAHGSIANGSLSSLHSKDESPGYVFPFQHNLVYPSAELLYTSPSMPNISLGRPPTSASGSPVGTEDDIRAAMSARLGIALPGPPHMISGALPGYFPALPVLDGEFPPGSTQAFLASQGKLSPSGTANSPLASPFIPVTAAPGPSVPHSAHRLHSDLFYRHRPLGRTHSAPLPLGVFHQQQNLLLQQQHEQYLKDQKLYVKQHIRQTVLQRSGSKSHMENVDEETEVKLAQEMKECREAETLEGRMEDISAPLSGQVISQHSSPLTAAAIAEHGRERDSHVLLSPHRDTQRTRHKGPSHHRPLSRTQSSPLVTFSVPPQSAQDSGPITYTFTTGLAYDNTMLKHRCTCNDHSNHLEHAGRIHSIWNRLTEEGLEARCEHVRSRKATIEELQSCHSEQYSLIFGGNPYNRQKLFESSSKRFCLLYCGGIGVDSDTVWNEVYTSTAARTAAGCVIELACRVAAGDLKNGFAVVRPPGHHAEQDTPMGFCYFNSVAIAAKQLKAKMNLQRILIVDWDVHHGNGTQKMTYDDPHILYISIHRHDNGNFFPGTGALDECGEGPGLGFNVNIAFGGSLNPPMGDAEYMAAFRTIVMPIAREFKPECVLVSAGYDAAKGHATALGGYEVSPECFGVLTRELMSLANGKVVLALEGGYDIPSICDSAELSVRALLGEELRPLREEELKRSPCKPAIDTLEATIQIQAEHWPCVKRYAGTTHHSLIDFQNVDMEEAATVSALASLSMVPCKQRSTMEQQSEPMEEGT